MGPYRLFRGFFGLHQLHRVYPVYEGFSQGSTTTVPIEGSLQVVSLTRVSVCLCVCV